MKFLVLSLILGLSLIAGELTLQSGSVMGLTGVVGDRNIDPKNEQLSAALSMESNDILTLKGTIDVKMAMFKSSNADRDEHMYEALEIEDFANSRYTIKSVEAIDTPDHYTLKGELELHGVKKPLDFKAKITIDGKTVTIEATSKINVEDYDIEMPCLLGFTMCVDENVAINGVAVLSK